MSRGTIALILGLFVLSALVILVVSVVVLFTGTLRESTDTAGIDLPEMLWMSLLRTLDPGTMGGDSGSVMFVLSMLTVTLGGIFIVATLIGVISTGIGSKLDELRKGRSIVLEDNHTVVLGWSPQIFDVISEIVLANANKRNQRIVVLADRDKVEMETEIRQRLPNTLTTRIVCRSGSPTASTTWQSPASRSPARSSSCRPRATIRTRTHQDLAGQLEPPGRSEAPYRVVAEYSRRAQVDVARLASAGQAQLVLGGELIGRIAAPDVPSTRPLDRLHEEADSRATRSNSSRTSPWSGKHSATRGTEFDLEPDRIVRRQQPRPTANGARHCDGNRPSSIAVARHDQGETCPNRAPRGPA